MVYVDVYVNVNIDVKVDLHVNVNIDVNVDVHVIVYTLNVKGILCEFSSSHLNRLLSQINIDKPVPKISSGLWLKTTELVSIEIQESKMIMHHFISQTLTVKQLELGSAPKLGRLLSFMIRNVFL